MTTVRRVAAACALAAGVCAAAGAQSPAPGWTLVVRIVPNPVPIGRCAGISIELQDADGYRTSTMSNGQELDFHRFTYGVDTTNFQWRDGTSTDGVLCPRTPGTPSQATVTVTLPDGLSGSAVLTSLAPGTSAPAVQYAPQAPLRGHGVPTPRHAAMITAPAQAAAPTSTPLGKTAPGASATYQPLSIVAAALQMTGTGTTFTALHVDGAPLLMTGNGLAFAPALVAAAPLGMVGGGFSPQPLTVDAARLGMTGNGLAFAPQTIEAARLSIVGQTP